MLAVSTAFAQGRRGDKNDKIKALLVAHLSKDLSLSTQEAEKFWPVFHESRQKIDDLQRKRRDMLRDLEDKLGSLSDNEAQKYIADFDAIDRDINKIEDSSKDAIIKIVGAKRFLLLKKSEMDFRRTMLEEFKERRGKPGKD